MKRVTLTYRKYVNHLEQEGRVVCAYHAEALDDCGTIVREVVTCDSVDIEEFCVQLQWGPGPPKRTRAIPLDLLFNIETEEV